jgi:hypothetical protein
VASKEDINNQKTLNEELNETKKTSQEINTEYASSRDILRQMQIALGKNKDATKAAASELNKLESIAQKLLLNEENIVLLTDKQIALNRDKASSALEGVKVAAQQLIEEKGIVDLAHTRVGMIPNLTESEKELLLAAQGRYEVEQSIVDAINKEVQEREDASAAMGVAGGILKGLNEIGGSFAKAFKLNEVVDDMEKFALQTRKAEGSVSRLAVLGVGMKSAFTNAFKTLTDPSVIISSLIKGFTAVDKQAVSFQRMTGQNMNTMATSAAAANTHFTTMADYIQTAGELTAELGMNANNILSSEDIQEASEMAHAMGMTGAEAAKITKISTTNGKSLRENNEAIVDSVNSFNKQNKTAVMASKVFKDIANVSDEIAILYTGYPEKLASAAAAANSIGMELSDVASIASNLLDFQSSIESEMEAELLTGQSLNLEKARSLALSNDLEGLAKEIANQGITQASFSALSAKGQAAQAKALGMSTAQMSKMLIQQGLTVGMSEEGLDDAQKQELSLMKQEEAQEKITKAIEKMQQVFAPIVEVVADVLTGFLGIVSGAFQLLGYLGLAKPLMYAIVSAIAISKFTSMAKAAGEFKNNLKDGLKIAGNLGKKIFGVGKNTKDAAGAAGSIGKGASKVSSTAGEGMDKAGESIGKSADKTKGVKGNKGEDIKNFLTGLAEGLKAMASMEVLQGGGALLASSPGLIGLAIASPGLYIISKINGEGFTNAMKGIANGIIAFGNNFPKLMIGTVAIGAVGLILSGAFYLAMMMIKDVDPVQMIAFSGSLAILGLTMAVLGNIGPNIMIGALAMGVLALSLIPAAYAFSLLAGVDAGSMFAFAGALSVLGLAAAGLGFLTPFIIGGAFALGVLGLALIPMGEALSNLQGVDVSVIMSFVGGVSALSLMAAGLGFLSPFIIAGSIALAFLGASLIPLAMGMERMASVDSEGMINSLVQLSMVAPGLFSTAAALYAVAGGFAAVGVAGYLALPALAAMSLFGTSESTEAENTEDSGMAKVNANLEKLISLVEAGGDVFIDGAKVGKTVQLASSKMG